MTPFSLFGNKKRKLTLILDVQSSVVRSAIVEGMNTSTPAIVHSCIIHVPFRHSTGSAYLIKKTLAAVREIVSDTRMFIGALNRRDYDTSLEDVHFVLSSPWITSQASVVSFKDEKEFSVDKKKIQSIIEEQRSKSAGLSSRLSLVEEKVFDVRLNGYSIDDWNDRRAKQIDISYTSSYSTESVIEKFRDYGRELVRKSHVHFHSSLLLQYIGVQRMFEQSLTYTIVYLHGELTDVVVVRHGFPIFFGSFPYGVSTLVRKIARSGRVDLLTADSMLSLLVGNHVDDAHFENTRKMIDDISNGWKKTLTDMIAPYVTDVGVGHDIIVSSRTHEDFFVSCIRSSYPRARVQSLSSESVAGMVAFSNKGEHIRLLALYAAALNQVGPIKQDK